MSSYLNSTALIASIKQRAMVPESQVTFTQQDFLNFANEEMQIGLVPAILQFHEEFLVVETEIPLVTNQSRYSIPDRALGSRLRDLAYKNSDGSLSEMTRIEPENKVFFRGGSGRTRQTTFYLENNSIVIVPEVTTATGSILVSYYQRPNQLVLENKVSTITAIDILNGILSVNIIPSEFTSSAKYDFLENKGTHKCREIDVTPLSISTVNKTITFNTADIPSDLAIGDVVALAGECLIPQVPDELHVVLAQRVACRCLEALGDAQNLQLANVKLQEMETKMGNLIDNRSEGTPQKANNVHSTLRLAKLYSRRRY